MLERRKYVRIPESLPVSYRILPKVNVVNFASRNLSQGGIRFYVSVSPPEKSVLKIRITIEKAALSFETLVQMRWSRKILHRHHSGSNKRESAPGNAPRPNESRYFPTIPRPRVAKNKYRERSARF